MKNLDLHSKNSVLWNGVYTIYYRCAYNLYLFLLYAYSQPKIFGIIGTYFSLIYLIKTIFELGIIQSLSPFFLTFTKSKQAFKGFFVAQVYIHTIFFLCTLPFLVLYYCYATPMQSLQIDSATAILLFVIFLLEFINHIIKKILNLALFYRRIAISEMIAITIFLSSILICFFCSIPLTSNTVFISFLIHSIFSFMSLGSSVFKWYQLLPNKSYYNNINIREVVPIRFFSFISTLGTTTFSSNFLIPLIAANQGFEVVSLYKLVGNFAHNIDLFLEHTFGQTNEIILSNIESSKNNYKQKVFAKLSKNIFHTISALFIFLTINHAKCFYLMTSTFNNKLALSLFFYFFILLNNSLFSPYKSLYAIQRYFTRYTIIKLCIFIIAFILILCQSTLSLVITLGLMLLLQFVSFGFIAVGAYRLWNINVSFISTLHIVSYTLASLAFFFLL